MAKRDSAIAGAVPEDWVSHLSGSSRPGDYDWRDPSTGVRLAIRVLAQPQKGAKGRPLVVCFHGAVDRSNRRLPVYAGEFLVGQVGGTIVGISDASLEKDSKLSICWYQGYEGFDVPGAIHAFLLRLVEAWAPSRIVLIGSSVGAHAALVQSTRLRDSVCVVRNPHTLLSAYYERHVARYRSKCWPNLSKGEPLSAVVQDDVARLYEKGHDNTVVYLQNATDRYHLETQLKPFLRLLPSFRRVILLTEFSPGHRGHNAQPLSLWIHWVAAALQAESSEVDSIFEASKTLLESADQQRSTGLPSKSSETPADRVRRRDLEIAELLASQPD